MLNVIIGLFFAFLSYLMLYMKLQDIARYLSFYIKETPLQLLLICILELLIKHIIHFILSLYFFVFMK